MVAWLSPGLANFLEKHYNKYMKLLVFYRQKDGVDSEYDDFMKSLSKLSAPYEQINPDSRDGSDRAEIYEVVSYPTIMLVDDDGRPLAIWRDSLPSVDQINTYIFI